MRREPNVSATKVFDGHRVAGAHIIGRVRIDVAVLEVDVAAADVDAPALPNEEGARIWSVPGKFLHWGVERMGEFDRLATHLLPAECIQKQAQTGVEQSSQVA